MKILALSPCNHDLAIAIIDDGRVVFNIEAERISRIKNDYNFTDSILESALDLARIDINDIDVVACSIPSDGVFTTERIRTLENFPLQTPKSVTDISTYDMTFLSRKIKTRYLLRSRGEVMRLTATASLRG